MSHIFCFFFSSRRRHTRWTGDWSSDVCSSDLLSASPNQLLPSANSWRRGHLWSLGRVAVRRQLVGGVLGRKRCCTSVLYGALAGRHSRPDRGRRQGRHPQDLLRHAPWGVQGCSPTGKQVSINVIGIGRITNGQVVEHWSAVDWMRLMQQFEATPTPESTG